jgi:CRISPR system Cascade subunit CasB
VASKKSIEFVQYILSRSNAGGDKGFRAKMRKADNESTEYQSWEILSQWTDLEWETDRKIYGLIGASLARLKQANDGTVGLGKALRLVFLSGDKTADLDKSPPALRLRRILACREKSELVEIVRPVLRYLESKDVTLCHAQLLDDLLRFDLDASRERVRSRWAQEFFSKKEES